MWFFKKKTLPYTLSTQHFAAETPLSYKLFDGVRVSDQKEFSIFEIKPDNSPLQQALAQNAIKIWRTFRHPAIPVFIDSYENDGANYVVTDKILPFDERKLSDSELSWAIYIMTDFVGFLGEDANAIHGNITGSSLFMTYGHELKIAGLHWMTVNGIGPIHDFYSDWCRFTQYATPQPPDGAPTYSIDVRFIAAYMTQWENRLSRTFAKYAKRWAPNIRNPPSPKSLLALDYWKTDKFMTTILFLRDLPLKDQFDRETFFKNLLDTINIFSVETQEHAILPTLLASLSFAQTPAVLENILAIGKNMGSEAFGQTIVPSLLPLFESKDRSIRVHLLSQIDKLIPHFSPKIINENVFPNVVLGLNDTVVAVKASTIIAMVPMASHLSINNGKTLLRELKRLQSDPDSSIRCNSVICLAKIAEYIEAEFRVQTLIQCFGKAATDPFGPARKAAISAYRTCNSYFNQQIIATSIMPVLSPLCVDPHMDIRSLAIKAMRDYIEQLSQDVPENTAEPEHTAVSNTSSATTTTSANLNSNRNDRLSSSRQNRQNNNIGRNSHTNTSSGQRFGDIKKKDDSLIRNSGTNQRDKDEDEEDDDSWGEPIVVKKPQKPTMNNTQLKNAPMKLGGADNKKKTSVSVVKAGNFDNDNEEEDDDDNWGDLKDVKVKAIGASRAQHQVSRPAQKPVLKPVAKPEIVEDGWSDDDIEFDEDGNVDSWGKQPVEQQQMKQPVKQTIAQQHTATKPSVLNKVSQKVEANSKPTTRNSNVINVNHFNNDDGDDDEDDDDGWGEPKEISVPKASARVADKPAAQKARPNIASKHEEKPKPRFSHEEHEKKNLPRAKKVIISKNSDGWDDDIDWDEED
ncbi:hypothetical protein TRFO_21290 [Tritrichomonas foetus]|uniref:HEAT repeat family protein n=1 Tax=Tritrichomonas foetus TaxID=1144522 RepID=A0A1J4KF84_9EUKA|nr:hypothetical protein TRFO_21290 [Tritrichomonas foetus]|eukprot:OHT09682.1 hypothetical protein TRFO_21290 [Tritrichomonas foetus]